MSSSYRQRKVLRLFWLMQEDEQSRCKGKGMVHSDLGFLKQRSWLSKLGHCSPYSSSCIILVFSIDNGVSSVHVQNIFPIIYLFPLFAACLSPSEGTQGGFLFHSLLPFSTQVQDQKAYRKQKLLIMGQQDKQLWAKFFCFLCWTAVCIVVGVGRGTIQDSYLWKEAKAAQAAHNAVNLWKTSTSARRL